MLKLKAPIQLHTFQGLTARADAFGERIRGNYTLMRAHFTPRELLFLLTAPSELPEDLGGMTMLVSQSSNVDMGNVTVDVVNNIVNRVMLDGTNQFTYQDQVYITNVLNKLGITNTEQFMSQIRRLRVENENTVHMTRLYQQEIKNFINQRITGDDDASLPIMQTGEKDTDDVALTDPRVDMCMSILNRLDTANIYETVYSFHRNQRTLENHFSRNEMRLSEYLRFGNSIALAGTKQQIMQKSQVNLAHHINQYETSVLLDPPKNEEAVLSQAAVAALVSAVDNTVIQVLNRPNITQGSWVHIENAIRQSAENTLVRFESYHNEPQILPGVELSAGEAWNKFVSDVHEYQDFYRHIHSNQVMQGEKTTTAPNADIQLTHVIHEENNEYSENTNEYNIINSEILKRTIREAGHHSLAGVVIQPYSISEHDTVIREIVATQMQKQSDRQVSNDTGEVSVFIKETLSKQTETMHRTEKEVHSEIESATMTFKEAEEQNTGLLVGEINRIEEQNRTKTEIQTQEIIRRELAGEKTPEQTKTIRDALRAIDSPEEVLREIYSSSETVKTVHPTVTSEEETIAPQTESSTREIYEKVTETQKSNEVSHKSEVIEHGDTLQLQADISQVINEAINVTERAESTADVEIPPVTMTLKEVEEQNPDLLIEEVNRIEEQNRIKTETLKQEIIKRELISEKTPDQAKTIRDALRAIDSPEEVLREIYSSSETVKTVHPTFTPEEEAILAQADPSTREIYEKILEYQKSPEAAQKQGVVKQVDILQLQTDISQVLNEAINITEHDGHSPSAQIPPATMTLKEAEEQNPELLVEEMNRIEQQNRTRIEQIKQEITHREASTVVMPDQAKTIRDALRAIDSPEEVLREIYSSVSEVRTVHPEFTSEEEAILNQADPVTREFYKKILMYQKSPETAIREGLLKPSNLGALQADIKKIMRDTSAEIEHPQTVSQAEKIIEESENILTKFMQMPKTAQSAEVQRQPHRAIDIVHKQAPPDVTEELLEKLEEHRVQQNVTVQTNEIINKQNTRQTEVNNLEKSVITHTNEDITELVNKTIAKQMKTISDQVYRQMEKRLQTERSRRGRF